MPEKGRAEPGRSDGPTTAAHSKSRNSRGLTRETTRLAGAYHRSPFLAVAGVSWAGGRRGQRRPSRAPAAMSGGRRGERWRERSATQPASGDEEVNTQVTVHASHPRSEDSEVNMRVIGGAHPSCHAPTSGPPAGPGFRTGGARQQLQSGGAARPRYSSVTSQRDAHTSSVGTTAAVVYGQRHPCPAAHILLTMNLADVRYISNDSS
jgi:hypothetical protein